MATTEHFKKKQPFDEYEYFNERHITTPLKIEVFGYNHKKTADELYKVLKESGFLLKHPCFLVKVETMDSYRPIIKSK